MSSCFSGHDTKASASSICEFAKMIEQQNFELVELIKSKYSYVSIDGTKFFPLSSRTRAESNKTSPDISAPRSPSSAKCKISGKRGKAKFPFKPMEVKTLIENPFRSSQWQGGSSKDIRKEINNQVHREGDSNSDSNSFNS